MSDAFWTSFWATLPILIASVAAAGISITNSIKLKTVHQQINSRMDQLLLMTAQASKAEGVKQESDRVK
jgi:hypothetical protein